MPGVGVSRQGTPVVFRSYVLGSGTGDGADDTGNVDGWQTAADGRFDRWGRARLPRVMGSSRHLVFLPFLPITSDESCAVVVGTGGGGGVGVCTDAEMSSRGNASPRWQKPFPELAPRVPRCRFGDGSRDGAGTGRDVYTTRRRNGTRYFFFFCRRGRVEIFDYAGRTNGRSRAVS